MLQPRPLKRSHTSRQLYLCDLWAGEDGLWGRYRLSRGQDAGQGIEGIHRSLHLRHPTGNQPKHGRNASETPPLSTGDKGGGCTFVREGLASSFFPCTDTFPAAAAATAAGFDAFAGSTLGASAFTVAAAALYNASRVDPLQAEPTRKHPGAKSRKKPRESDTTEQKERERSLTRRQQCQELLRNQNPESCGRLCSVV